VDCGALIGRRGLKVEIGTGKKDNNEYGVEMKYLN
jgi:hypothetical protein